MPNFFTNLFGGGKRNSAGGVLGSILGTTGEGPGLLGAIPVAGPAVSAAVNIGGAAVRNEAARKQASRAADERKRLEAEALGRLGRPPAPAGVRTGSGSRPGSGRRSRTQVLEGLIRRGITVGIVPTSRTPVRTRPSTGAIQGTPRVRDRPILMGRRTVGPGGRVGVRRTPVPARERKILTRARARQTVTAGAIPVGPLLRPGGPVRRVLEETGRALAGGAAGEGIRRLGELGERATGRAFDAVERRLGMPRMEMERRSAIIARHRGDPRFGDVSGILGRTEGGLVGENYAIHPATGTLADFQQIMADGFIPRRPFYKWDWRTNVFRKVARRKMNPLNFSALKRAGRRLESFEKTIKRAFSISKKRTVKPKRRRRRK